VVKANRRGGPERRWRPRPDGTLGPHWARDALGPQGLGRSPAVTSGQDEPQIGRAPQRSDTAKYQISPSVARERVGARERRCRIARMADELMPMAVYYRTHRSRWAA
jgi:hypothetical protein